MRVRVVTAATTADGRPGFRGATTEVTQDEYDAGEHYRQAEEAAREDGYEGKMVSFDENDGPDWLFKHVFVDMGD